LEDDARRLCRRLFKWWLGILSHCNSQVSKIHDFLLEEIATTRSMRCFSGTPWYQSLKWMGRFPHQLFDPSMLRCPALSVGDFEPSWAQARHPARRQRFRAISVREN
jgi:hypothetical protein